MNVKFYTYQTY